MNVKQALKPNGHPFLYKAALSYYAAFMASVMTFQDLYKELEKYVDNPDQRWKQCVRVKRGLYDTKNFSGMYKDQVHHITQLIIHLFYRYI